MGKGRHNIHPTPLMGVNHFPVWGNSAAVLGHKAKKLGRVHISPVQNISNSTQSRKLREDTVLEGVMREWSSGTGKKVQIS